MVSVIRRESPIPADNLSSGGRLVAVDGRVLPLESTSVRCDAAGGLARVIVEQRFTNPHDSALRVRYLLPLPADGAVSGFQFQIGDHRILGEVDKKKRARERFEQALLEGKTAAILEQARTSLFEEEVGNIPPGKKVIVEVIIDQPLIWLAEGAWQWRFPTVVGPRYMGKPGRVADAGKINVPIADGGISTRMTLTMHVRDALGPNGRFESSSHTLDVTAMAERTMVTLKEASRLDRDVVVQWPVARPEVGVSLHAARPARAEHEGRAYGLLTLVPPLKSAAMPKVARDLIFLIDTSGSMGGEPLDQAKRVVQAMIETLDDEDQLELIEFSSHPRRWKGEPVMATLDGKRAAQRWVSQLNAGGSTEMHEAILSALKPLRRDSQRQIVVITDGYIGFEQEILETVIEHLPPGARVHTVGVGNGINRSLTQPLARAGAGIEVICAPGEDADRMAKRLIDRTASPLVTELSMEGPGILGSVPAHLPDVFAEVPVRIAAELNPEGGAVRVRGKIAGGGEYRFDTVAPKLASGAGNGAIVALFGRELVEDLETKKAAQPASTEIDPEIERIGLLFQIATRLTSWVAISQERMIAEGTAQREETMPHELVAGVSAEGVGLRAPGSPMMMGSAASPKGGAARAMGPMTPSRLLAPAPMDMEKKKDKAAAFDEDDVELDAGEAEADGLAAPEQEEFLERREIDALSNVLEEPAKVRASMAPLEAQGPSFQSVPAAEDPRMSGTSGMPRMVDQMTVTRAKLSPFWLVMLALFFILVGVIVGWLLLSVTLAPSTPPAPKAPQEAPR
ncbi:MAG: VIT domain-containing protein [Myxococcota bacterium]